MASARIYATRSIELNEALDAAPRLGIEARSESARLHELALIGYRALQERSLEHAYDELAADQARRSQVRALAQASIDAGLL